MWQADTHLLLALPFSSQSSTPACQSSAARWWPPAKPSRFYSLTLPLPTETGSLWRKQRLRSEYLATWLRYSAVRHICTHTHTHAYTHSLASRTPDTLGKRPSLHSTPPSPPLLSPPLPSPPLPSPPLPPFPSPSLHSVALDLSTSGLQQGRSVCVGRNNV